MKVDERFRFNSLTSPLILVSTERSAEKSHSLAQKVMWHNAALKVESLFLLEQSNKPIPTSIKHCEIVRIWATF